MKTNKKTINLKAEIMIKILLILTLIFLLVMIPMVFAQTGNNVCCEFTKTGAWCQNTLEANCNPSYRVTQTSCQATSFCKPGCCVDTDEGSCSERTPERVCSQNEGTWYDDSECNVPQCDLGCCLLGDQASFVTLTRCKKLSGFYGLETNFDSNIPDETSCILTAHLQDKGACVFDSEGQKNCRLTTRKVCMDIVSTEGIAAEFHNGFLCSADELATICGPTTETMCIEGKDEVYFKDSCGNSANIYDADKTYNKNPDYWRKIVDKGNSCGVDSEDGNGGSAKCGNCDYFKGSICRQGSATYGDYQCKDLNCYAADGNYYKNGESWCVYQGNVGLGRDLVGSRHFRHICINGEEIEEPCADYRKEICREEIIQTNDGDFKEAACRINRWKDCIDQTEKDDCLNGDKRDCYWVGGVYFVDSLGEAVGESELTATSSQVFSGGNTGGFSGGVTGNAIAEINEDTVGRKGLCLPEVPPGLKFWNSDDAASVCSLGSATCSVKYEKGVLTGLKDKPVENEYCLTEAWAAKMNNICTSLGDCGAYLNIGKKFTDKGAQWRIAGEKQVLSGLLDDVRRKAGV